MKNKKPKKNTHVFRNRSGLFTLLLLLCIIGMLIPLLFRIDTLTKEQCYQTLTASTKEVNDKFESNFNTNRSSLRLLSKVISQEENLNSGAVNEIMTAYSLSSLVSNLAILTPENTIIQIRGGNIENNNLMDYETEAALGEHVSALQPALTSPDQKILRSFVSITKSRKTIGLLFLELNPAAIASAWVPEIYDHSASYCVVDRSTGEILINSMMGRFRNLEDFSSEKLINHLKNGDEGFMQMDVEQQEEDIFVSYMPMNIENWEIMVTVPEDSVFAMANRLHSSLQIFVVAMAALLVAYLILMIYNNRRSIAAAEKQANMDVLTGLQNRNRYEAFCCTLDGRIKDFSCIYIDVNGLHEINNNKGHLAGDQMLRFIADTLKIVFGEDTVYRIGGDEFIVFQKNRTEQELLEDLNQVYAEVEKNDYHVSAGVCSHSTEKSVNEMVKSAEKKMYAEKKLYYERIGKQVRNNIDE